MAELLPMSSPDLTATDIAAVNHVLAARCLSLGPQLEAFEEAVVSCVGLDVELYERSIILRYAARGRAIRARDQGVGPFSNNVVERACSRAMDLMGATATPASMISKSTGATRRAPACGWVAKRSRPWRTPATGTIWRPCRGRPLHPPSPRVTDRQPCESLDRVVDWSGANGSDWLTGKE